MNTSLSQAFRAQSQTKVITIPTRHDPKSNQRIVRWKDIQQFFMDAQGVMNGDDAVLFLTDNDLDDLIPLRIAHHPGVILEVVMTADCQHDSGSAGPSSNSNSHTSGTGDTRLLERDTIALRITDVGDGQALVLHSQSLPSENQVSLHSSSPLYNTAHRPSTISPQGHPTSNTDQFIDGGTERRLLEMSSTMAQQEELRQLRHKVQQMQQQMDEMQQTMQQKVQETQQQAQVTQQQTQHQIDEILQRVQELSQREQRIDDVEQKIQVVERQVQHSQEQQKQHMDATLQEVREKLSDSQKQIEEVLQKIQLLNQQTQHPQPRPSDRGEESPVIPEFYRSSMTQKMDQQPRQVTQDSQPPGLKWLADDRLVLMKSRINEALNASFSEFSVPRLFIVLPHATSTDDSKESRRSQFRLYFLCEFSTDTEPKEGEDVHEIHMENHPGYEISDPDGFFNKFGPYLLTMMYMVRLRSAKRVVTLPMESFRVFASRRVLDQDHLSYVKDNIDNLIDETIRHLEETAGEIGDNMGNEEYRIPSSLELNQVKQYLKVEDGKDVSGGLKQTAVQDEHCKWMCPEHHHRRYESDKRHLEEVIAANGGSCSLKEGYTRIRSRSESLTKQLYRSMINLCNTQTIDNRRSLKLSDLETDSGSSESTTTDIVINFFSITTLELEFSQLLINIRSSEGTVRDVEVKIDYLFALTQDDLDFIRQCHDIQLWIANASEEEDEERLVETLRLNHRLTELRIGCSDDRSFALIDLIVSTRENIIQYGGTLSLRTFKLTDGRHNFWMEATLSFTTDSITFAMETYIRLTDRDIPIESPVYNFLRQYGWSIETLGASGAFNDSLASLLDRSTQERGSRIKSLYLDPYSLTTSGLNALDQAIGRSQSLNSLVLTIRSSSKYAVEAAKILLGRHGKKLSKLEIITLSSAATSLPGLAEVLPTRSGFPALERFSVQLACGSETPEGFSQWISSMISIPPQEINTSHTSAAPLPFQGNRHAESFSSLVSIGISEVVLESGAWKSLINAIDFSSLTSLSFWETNFSQDQLRVLVDRINEVCPAVLKDLSIYGSSLVNDTRTRTLIAKIELKCPGITFSSTYD